MAESLKQKTFKGTIWSAIESFSVQGIQFIVMLIMARILTPADYGIVGMIAIFIAVSNSLINCGFSQALIRKKDRSEVDNSTVFYFNIVVSLILYLILFFCAPFIARFYDEPMLTSVTRVVSIGIILGSFNVVQTAQFIQSIDFKTLAKASCISTCISGTTGIILAYKGLGVWALVTQQISNALINTIILWIYSNWRPKRIYSWNSFHELFGFGSKLMISGLINTIYNNVYALVIGKVFKAADLGFYSRASSFSSLISANITVIIQKVTYPVLSQVQENDQILTDGYRKIIKISAFIIFPLMIGLCAIAKPMVTTLLTEKWIYSAILLVPICLSGMWYPVHAINLNLLQVKGRSDLFLRLEIIKKFIGISILCITIPMGLYIMCWGSVLNSLIALLINTHYTGKLLNLGFLKQMKDLTPILVLSLAMGVIVWTTINLITLPQPVLLILGILEGAVIYITGSKLFRFPEFAEIRSLLQRKK